MSFYQPSTDQSQNQPKQGGYDFGDYNFSQQPPPPPYGGYYQPMPQQPKRNRGRRNCLLFLGCSALAVVVICGCMFGVVYTAREVVITSMWIQIVSGEGVGTTYDDLYELEIVCADSQGERFSEQFERRYPDGVSITLDNNSQLSGADGAVQVSGTLVDKQTNEESIYEATFYVSHDKGGLPLLGCIDRIEQVSPEFSIIE